MRLYREVFLEYQHDDDFVHLGNRPAPSEISQSVLDAKRDALKTKITQTIAEFQFSDNFYYEKQLLTVLFAARQSLEVPGTEKYIGSQTLSGYFDANETACKMSSGVEALVREAILCNIIQDELDLMPSSPVSEIQANEETKVLNSAAQLHNQSIHERKSQGAGLDLSRQVDDRFETYLLLQAKNMAIRVRSLYDKKDGKTSNPLKMNLLKAANALLEQEGSHGYSAESLAAYDYALDQYKPELRDHRGKAREKGMLSFMRDRTESLLDEIENLVHKMASHSPVNQARYLAAYEDCMTQDLRKQVAALLTETQPTDRLTFSSPPEASKINLLRAAQLLLNDHKEPNIGNYLYQLSEYKRLNTSIFGQLFSDNPIFEEKTEALIRKIDHLFELKNELKKNASALKHS